MNDTLSNDSLLSAIKTEAKLISPGPQTPSQPLNTITPQPGAEHYHIGEFLHIFDDELFIDCLYQCLLGRTVDTTSLDNSLRALKGGTTRIQLACQLKDADEAQAKHYQLTGIQWSSKIRQFDKRFPKISSYLHRFKQIIYKAEERKAKIDAQNIINEKLSQKVTELQEIKLKQQQQRIQTSHLEQHIATLRIELRQLQKQQERASTRIPTAQNLVEPHQDPVPEESDAFQQFYLAFENRFRGTQEQIHIKLSQYLAYLPPLTATHNTILDIGCGRGEWLSLVKQAGYQELGLDANLVMIETCQQQGLTVQATPLHQWLAHAENDSIAGLTGFHIAEHLPFTYLLELLQETARVLKPGGVLILETPNPENTSVGSHSFYHDPTHKNPLTPSLMQFVAEYIGLVDIQILRLNPLPESQHLSSDTPESHFLNAKFCNAQDYALIAYKPNPEPVSEIS